MATIIGRLACHLCKFDAAHVKRSDNKRPYSHCPECGAMLHTKNGHQERLLLALMRPVDGYIPEPPGTAQPIIVRGGVKDLAAKPAPAPAPAEAKPARPATWLDNFLPKS